MPELPDVELYVERLNAMVSGARLDAVRLNSPFLLRTVDPPLSCVEGAHLVEARRIGKRIALAFDSGPCLVLHLMIAGRVRWKRAGAALPKGNGLAAFDFDRGTLVLTEASKRKRAKASRPSGAAYET